MAFLLFRECNMDTRPNQQPPHSADARPSPVRVSEPETADATKRRDEPAPPESQQPIDEPGYGHGV
jgi:hypothetical protein